MTTALALLAPEVPRGQMLDNPLSAWQEQHA